MTCMNSRLIPLLLLSALVATIGVRQVCAQQGESRVALAIGNADYPDAEAPLKETLGNTRALADELKRQGFEVDVGENLTKEAMRAAIERFYGKIKPDSTALIFFSGYGIQSNRQTYIVPVNAQIWTEADVRRDGFNLELDPGRDEFQRCTRQDCHSRRVTEKSFRASLPQRPCRARPGHCSQ